MNKVDPSAVYVADQEKTELPSELDGYGFIYSEPRMKLFIQMEQHTSTAETNSRARGMETPTQSSLICIWFRNCFCHVAQ